MVTTIIEPTQDLAFAHWKYNANEKAYSAKLITKAMYEYARDELHKIIEYLSTACYTSKEDIRGLGFDKQRCG